MGPYDFLVPGQPRSYIDDMSPGFAENLHAFIAASPGMMIYSGARSNQRQAELYDAAVKKYGTPEAARKWVAPPGKSMHNRGEAADLRFTGEGALDWAHKHAADYGLTFPMAHENWHIEPVGARQGPQLPGPENPNAATVQAGGGNMAFNPFQYMQERNPMVRSAMTMFDEGYSSDRFMADMLSGQNPLRNAFYGGLGRLFRGIGGA